MVQAPGRAFQGLLLAAVVVIMAPLAALCEPAPEERSPSPPKGEVERRDLAQGARLRNEALTFLHLPAQRQEQLIKLEQDFDALPPSTQTHLLAVARRYTDWLQGLPQAERQKLNELMDPNTRLQRIRALREEEWTRRFPRLSREKLAQAKPEERGKLIQQFRTTQRMRSRQWKMAFQHWDELIKKQPMPGRLADFPPDVQTYVKEFLRPMLTAEEKTRLDKAEGKWPLYPYTLVILADKHPMALPGKNGPTQFKDLPVEVQNSLNKNVKKFGMNNLKKAEGKWPDYAQVVSDLARNRSFKLPYELWPSRREDLSPPMVNFLEKKLLPVLSSAEKTRLRESEKKWPLYPRTIQDLAQQHHLNVPWQALPGTRERWDSYRLRMARLPAPALFDPEPLTP